MAVAGNDKRGAGFTIVLMAGMSAQSLIFAPIAPALPAIAARAGVHGETVAQLCFALPALGLILAGLVAGPAIDRAGARATIIAGLSLYMIAGTGPVLFDAPVPLLATRLLTGFATGLVTTCATVLLVGAHAGEARGRMIGYQTATGSALGLATLVAGGAIVRETDWHLLFLLYGGVAAVFLLFAVLFVPSTRPTPAHSAAAAAPAGYGAVFRLMWPVYLAAGLLFIIPTACGSQLPFLLRATGIDDPLVHALVIACVNLGSMASGVSFGRIEAALDRRRTFALSLAMGALGALLIGVGRSPIVFGLGALLSGAGLGLYFPYLWLVATSLPPPELRARCLALMSSAMFAGGFLYPTIFGPLAGLFGRAGAFLAIAAVLAGGMVAALAVRRGRLLPPARTDDHSTA